MRALLAIVLYGLAAVSGLAAGYYAMAPGTIGERARARAEQRAYQAALDEEFSKMDAAAAFLAEEQKRADAQHTAAPAARRGTAGHGSS